MKISIRVSEQNIPSKRVFRLLLGLLLFGGVLHPSHCQQGLVESNFLGYLKPRHSTEIENSMWGIQAGTHDPNILEKAARIGVKWTRLGASWGGIENEKGKYDWEKTDEAFSASLEKGITPFVTLGGGNELYTGRSTYDDPKLAEIYGYRPGPPTANPEAMEAWLRFVEATLNRYKDQIEYWEVWNEPNHRNYWGAPPDGKEYGRLLKETAQLIRKIDPEAIIIGGSTAGLHPDFTEDFLSVGTADLIDIISYHNYGSIPEERIYRAVKVQEVIDKYNPDLEVWQGECGFPSHSSTRDYRGHSPWGLNIQAKWLLRQAFTDVYFCRATLSNYFKLVHRTGRGEKQERSPLSGIDLIMGFPERGGSRVRTKGVNEKCLLTNPTLEPKPGYFTYRNLCALMDGRYRRVEIESKVTIQDSGVFYGIGAEDDAFPSIPLVASFKTSEDHYLIAHWLPWRSQENLLKMAKIDLSVEDVQFEDPVLVDLLTGKVFAFDRVETSVNHTILKDLPLADYPLIIVERSEIELVPEK